ncbi:MAG: class I SAM-dependent methyltransferase [Pyrinomonadaceae bacterium]
MSARFDFNETDIKKWEPNEKYDVVIANHSLHHVVDLEALFESIHLSLDEKGFFLSNDMIGRNGDMRWPESLETMLALWSVLDERHKLNHATGEYEPVYENYDSSGEGFEGIRAQDILPLLLQKFHFDLFLGFNNLISVFIDRNFGPNFDPDDARDRHFIDFVSGLDDYFIEVGKLKPTQMVVAMVKYPVKNTRVYRHLTPEFCLRPPHLDQNYIYITDPNPYAIRIGLIKKIRRRGFHKIIPKSLRVKLKELISKFGTP